MTAALLDTFIDLNIMLLLVLAIRIPVARYCGAGWAYALWLLPALKLAIPPLPFLGGPNTLPSATIWIGGGGSGAPLPVIAGPGQWVPALLALWAGGAFLFLCWQAWLYLAFLRRATLGAQRRQDSHLEGIEILTSHAVEGPVAVGLLRPRILLPADFATRYGPEERDFALAHEATHHRRGDLWWNLAAITLLAASWFNPLAYLAFRAFRTDQELACDARVIAECEALDRHSYATALVKSASAPGLIAACPLHHADQLKRRLKMMKTHRRSRLRNAAGWTAITAVAGVALGLSAPSAAQDGVKQEGKPEIVREFRITHVGKDGETARHGELDARHMAEMEAKCADGERAETRIDTGGGEKKSKLFIVLCEQKGTTPAAMREKMIAALEKAQGHVATGDRMPAERRAEVAARIAEEIARLRSEKD